MQYKQSLYWLSRYKSSGTLLKKKNLVHKISYKFFLFINNTYRYTILTQLLDQSKNLSKRYTNFQVYKYYCKVIAVVVVMCFHDIIALK